METQSTQNDDPEALWVKWRGKWQTCICCSRADHPLSTLKAKPKHERKKYLVVFFPNTKTYSWVDTQLLCPIGDSPAPLSSGTHDSWMALVKDLTLPRQYIMKKLAVLMLDISDQLHTEAVIESARRAATWKVFAEEASFCREYPELGMMLLKLHSMILPKYIQSDWSEHSFNTWVKKCQQALSAETIELLTEELVDSVQWADVDKLWDAPVQPELGTEWRTWKQEVMKNLFTVLSDKSTTVLSPEICRNLSVEGIKSSGSKSPDTSTSDKVNMKMIAAVDHDTNFPKKHRLCNGFVEAKGRQCGRWANDGEKYCRAHLGNVSSPKYLTPKNAVSYQDDEGSVKFRRCSAFMEAKGKQCGRWANEGDIYCCVHLTNHFMGRKSGPESTPLLKSSSMCEGMTIYGKKCKHRARSGSVFCKKHHIRVTYNAMISGSNAPHDSEEKLFDERRFPLNLPEYEDASDFRQCIGHGDDTCGENSSSFTLYCQRHIPKFLRRTRNGSRILSKEAFAHILRSCSSRKDKIFLHRASELLYNFMKSSLSNQKPNFLQEDRMKWVLSEAAKDPNVGEYLLKLVCYEREKIRRVYGFDAAEIQVEGLKCKICGEGFSENKLLSSHWVETHNKEAQWLFTGYACAICRSPFTNRKVLEVHVRERHGPEFLDDSLLLRCMACNSFFSNWADLWDHVLACHSSEFRLPDSTKSIESFTVNGTLENEDGSRRYGCRLCGSKFDLLPDLGRHHQAAHMITNNSKHLKHRRIHRSRLKKAFGPVGPTNRFKKLRSFGMKKCAKAISSVVSSRLREQAQASKELQLKKLVESDFCLVAEALFSEMKKAKSLPSNSEILTIAKSTCCKTNIHDVLTKKYGTLPRNLYLKAAKLCSEVNFPVNWHLEGFICPKGCNSPGQSQPCFLSPLVPLASKSEERTTSTFMDDMGNGLWAMDECHYVLNPENFTCCPVRKTITLCEDISFGLESVPVPCVIDESIINEQIPTSSRGSFFWQSLGFSMPWLGFSYAIKRLLDPALGLDTASSQLGCACSGAKCSPETCDHVYLFDNDYEDAKDVDGNLMRGRFPYDETGRIVLEEGCLVYECNSMCSCDKTCQNRILQNGVKVKLEVFRTEKKGWAVRAAEAISRGRFICEYIGEVLNDVEATHRGERYDIKGCSYLYDIDAHIDGDDDQMGDVRVPYVVDATKHGNVARFINHSCSPNLVNYQVLIESMDCQLAHIGLYAARDIPPGEELSYDYRYKLLPGVGCPCHCGAPNCRGRLY